MARQLTRLMDRLADIVGGSYQESPWKPAVDIYRSHEGWLAKFDLAGVRPQDIQVTARGHCLTICGVRRDWLIREGHRSHSMEISYNRFLRSIQFPCRVDDAQMAVEYRDGMLLVRLITEVRS
jgi:HSP20 family protein